ncbi:MAG: DUF3754 domain-containing protein [Phycisphaerae bacterium]
MEHFSDPPYVSTPSSGDADSPSPVAPLLREDRYVPLRPSDLIDALGDEIEQRGGSVLEFRAVAAAIRDILEQESACFERELDDRYAPCNPDIDTVTARQLAARTPEHYAVLNRWLAYLFEKANFAKLSELQLDQVMRIARTRGLRVRLNPERIADLQIWVRGRGRVTRRRWSWRHPIRGELDIVPVFRRLAIAARMRDESSVILKVFKDIPEDDVEALLPHAEVKMSWLDHVTTLGGGFSALGGTAWKVITTSVALTFVALTQLIWMLSFGLCVMAYRLFIGYRRAKANRNSQRTQHLYYQNLSNNTGTLHMLVTMIAAEEVKEAVLAYAMCCVADRPTSEAQLATRAGDFLRRRFQVTVNFDTADAVHTLERLRLWNDRDEFRVLPPERALDRLREHWQVRRSERHHCAAAAKHE